MGRRGQADLRLLVLGQHILLSLINDPELHRDALRCNQKEQAKIIWTRILASNTMVKMNRTRPGMDPLVAKFQEFTGNGRLYEELWMAAVMLPHGAIHLMGSDRSHWQILSAIGLMGVDECLAVTKAVPPRWHWTDADRFKAINAAHAIFKPIRIKLTRWAPIGDLLHLGFQVIDKETDWAKWTFIPDPQRRNYYNHSNPPGLGAGQIVIMEMAPVDQPDGLGTPLPLWIKEVDGWGPKVVAFHGYVHRDMIGGLNTNGEYCLQQMAKAPGGSDLQLIWYRAFINSAVSDAAIAHLNKMFEGKAKLKAFNIDQERRWEILQTLARHRSANVEALIQAELKADPTDFGQKSAIAAETAIPDLSVKKKWATLMMQEEPTLPVAKLRVAMKNFNLLGQENLSQSNTEFYFESLPKLAQRKKIDGAELLKDFAQSMYPALCDPKIIDRTTQLIEAHPELPAEVVKSLKIHRQEEERCTQARLQSKQPS